MLAGRRKTRRPPTELKTAVSRGSVPRRAVGLRCLAVRQAIRDERCARLPGHGAFIAADSRRAMCVIVMAAVVVGMDALSWRSWRSTSVPPPEATLPHSGAGEGRLLGNAQLTVR